MNAAVVQIEDGGSRDYLEGMARSVGDHAAQVAHPLPAANEDDPFGTVTAEEAEESRRWHQDLMRRLFTLRVKRVHQDALLPRYASEGAAAFDVCAVGLGFHTRMVQAGTAQTFRTGLAFEIPHGHVMLVFSRSGHGFKQDVRLANCVGVIDSDYRGELQVKLTADAHGGGIGVRDGDRIAQCIVTRAPQWHLVEVDELTDTARGAGGFGSTGR